MRFVIAIALGLLTNPVLVHNWYEEECCDKRDCSPAAVHGAKITYGPQGYVVKYRGHEFSVPFDDERIRPSKDRHFHPCFVQGELSQDVSLKCFYVPEGET